MSEKVEKAEDILEPSFGIYKGVVSINGGPPSDCFYVADSNGKAFDYVLEDDPDFSAKYDKMIFAAATKIKKMREMAN